MHTPLMILISFFFFFFNDTATTEIYTLSLHDALPISLQCEFYALEGLTHLLKTIKLVRERLNPRLSVEGIVLTMFDGRTSLPGPSRARGVTPVTRPSRHPAPPQHIPPLLVPKYNTTRKLA